MLATSGATTDTCVLCAAGKYAANVGSSVCTDCAAGKYLLLSSPAVAGDVDAEADCKTCGANVTSPAGSSAKTDCKCNVHYWGPAMGTNDVALTCTACGANAGTGTATGSTAQTACGCNAGYYGNATATPGCQACA